MTDITWSLRTFDISALTEYAKNPRSLSKEQFAHLKTSLDKFGVIDKPIINADAAHTVIGGHQRLHVLKTEGVTQVECWYPSRELTGREVEELNIRLNKNTGAWDFDVLANEWQYPDLIDWGFDEKELLGLDFGTADPPEDPGAQINKAEELRAKWGVESGQLWQLGEHRLICGDCTDREVVERVMGGENADACISDPPYGIEFDTDYTRFTIQSGKNNKYEPIQNDDKPFDPTPYLDYPAVVLWGANYYADKLPRGTWLIWDKRFSNGEAWLSDAEIAWMKSGTGVYIFSLTSQGFVRPEKVEHPTQKAVALMEWCIEKSKAGILIYDPFSGSGTTLIACERLSRKCRAVEISPAYVAVALQRWADMTGKTPVLIDGD